MIVFDIETIALPLDKLKELVPPFDPESVKLGVLKDPVKIKAKLADAEESYWPDIQESAALDARYSQCACIGFMETDDVFTLRLDKFADEQLFLDAIWLRIEAHWEVEHVGFNSNHFDLPYLIRRSWLVGAVVPPILDARGYFLPWFVDLLDAWRLGDRQLSTGGLKQMLQAFGLPGKTGDGAEFGKLWESDREKAVAYMVNDIKVTYALAKKMLPLPISRQRSAKTSADVSANLDNAGF